MVPAGPGREHHDGDCNALATHQPSTDHLERDPANAGAAPAWSWVDAPFLLPCFATACQTTGTVLWDESSHGVAQTRDATWSAARITTVSDLVRVSVWQSRAGVASHRTSHMAYADDVVERT